MKMSEDSIIKKQVLLYNLDSDNRLRKIRRFFRDKKAEVITVDVSEYLESLGFILGFNGFAKSGSINMAERFSEEMMVMSGFSSEEIDDILAFFKEEELKPIELKAVVTPVNISWDSLKLYNELIKEKKYMS